MRIIKNNVKYTRIKCEYCKSILEFCDKDIQKKAEESFWTDSVRCPCCGKYILLSINGEILYKEIKKEE